MNENLWKMGIESLVDTWLKELGQEKTSISGFVKTYDPETGEFNSAVYIKGNFSIDICRKLAAYVLKYRNDVHFGNLASAGQITPQQLQKNIESLKAIESLHEAWHAINPDGPTITKSGIYYGFYEADVLQELKNLLEKGKQSSDQSKSKIEIQGQQHMFANLGLPREKTSLEERVARQQKGMAESVRLAGSVQVFLNWQDIARGMPPNSPFLAAWQGRALAIVRLDNIPQHEAYQMRSAVEQGNVLLSPVVALCPTFPILGPIFVIFDSPTDPFNVEDPRDIRIADIQDFIMAVLEQGEGDFHLYWGSNADPVASGTFALCMYPNKANLPYRSTDIDRSVFWNSLKKAANHFKSIPASRLDPDTAKEYYFEKTSAFWRQSLSTEEKILKNPIDRGELSDVIDKASPNDSSKIGEETGENVVLSEIPKEHWRGLNVVVYGVPDYDRKGVCLGHTVKWDVELAEVLFDGESTPKEYSPKFVKTTGTRTEIQEPDQSITDSIIKQGEKEMSNKEETITQFLKQLGAPTTSFNNIPGTTGVRTTTATYMGLQVELQILNEQILMSQFVIGYAPPMNAEPLLRQLMILNSMMIGVYFCVFQANNAIVLRSSRMLEGLDFVEFKQSLDTICGAFMQNGVQVARMFQISPQPLQ